MPSEIQRYSDKPGFPDLSPTEEYVLHAELAAARREGKREGLEEALTEVEAFSPVWHAIRARLEASE